jgi:integrase/recombinase XerD
MVPSFPPTTVRRIGALPAAALPYSTCCHTFRATGITTYMQNGGTLEHAHQIAAHESPGTTKLYDRTQDEISLDEVEGIRI